MDTQCPSENNHDECVYTLLTQMGGRVTFEDARRSIRYVLDVPEGDFHLDAHETALSCDLRMYLTILRMMQLVPLDEDECDYDPSLELDEGWHRIYFRPITPVDDRHIETYLEVG